MEVERRLRSLVAEAEQVDRAVSSPGAIPDGSTYPASSAEL